MSKNRNIRASSAHHEDRRREVFGVVGLGIGLFLLIAMLSLQAGRLVMGPFGNSSAGLFYGLAGIPGYCLIALGLVAAVRTLLEREPVMPILVTVGVVIGVVSLATLVHLAAPSSWSCRASRGLNAPSSLPSNPCVCSTWRRPRIIGFSHCLRRYSSQASGRARHSRCAGMTSRDNRCVSGVPLCGSPAESRFSMRRRPAEVARSPWASA
jgi:hypothetical protein